MSADKTPDSNAINDYLRSNRGEARRFTVVQDGRSGHISTRMPDGEIFTGPDSVNDAIFRFATGAEPRNLRPDDDETGGAA